MKINSFLFLFGFLLSIPITAAASKPKIAAGPYLMHRGETEAIIWVLFEGNPIPEITIKESESKREISSIDFSPTNPQWKNYTPAKISVKALKPDTEYNINFYEPGGSILEEFHFTTLKNNPAEFSFLLGSCAFQAQGPGMILKNGSMEIFDKMAQEESDFMLWLGDNFYYLYGEWNSNERMHKKQIKTRLDKHLNVFMKTTAHYQVWDDHDFGPNNSDGTWDRKNESLEICKSYWGNPSFGTAATPGNFCNFKVGDAEFFLVDDRFHRSPPDDPSGGMLGGAQFHWLLDALKKSTANFKLICIGSQVINTVSPSESWSRYPAEKNEFLKFIVDEKIEGVMLLTGDRHWTEMLTTTPQGGYPLYDLTVSPLTSWARKFRKDDPEENNPNRVEGTFYNSWNYGRITISGKKENAILSIEIKDDTGKTAWTKTISRKELSF